ncbi:hypothetical protein [Phreatobacter sp. AB_2022a]|uniref:hypothetical protein n=1 Tax=Phreatobacter sp. AB_2022a TaxID=3003134 RepID=UPI002286FB37|nr:hypothetical protein [Phreatobacter sp. AB_2022a]MCZ0734777.1 hypothetical protein [Phreatobacter sp. AB_2022a]
MAETGTERCATTPQPPWPKARRNLAVLAALFGLALAVPALALSTASPERGVQPPAGAAPAVPAWQIAGPRHGGFDLDAPRWRPLGQTSRVLRRADGLTRDLFLFGDATGSRRHAALAVDRGATGTASAAADLAALLADLGLPARLLPNHLALDSKFGPLSTADIAMDGPDGPKACLGFALRSAEAELRVAGWICNAGPEIVSRTEASCFIDRLVTIGAGDASLTRLFAQAELQRRPCNPAQPGASAGAGRTIDSLSGRLRLRRL